jgi:hypothetical protein
VKKVAELRKENKEMKKLVDNLKRKCLERVEE